MAVIVIGLVIAPVAVIAHVHVNAPVIVIAPVAVAVAVIALDHPCPAAITAENAERRVGFPQRAA